VLAHLGLELLLEIVELTLVTIEIVIVRLLGEMSHDLAWWIIKVSLLTVRSELSVLLELRVLAALVALGTVDECNTG
jgi:hypothetical protein